MTEIPPPASEDSESPQVQQLVEIYNSIEEKVPAIAYASKWKAWVRKGDKSPDEFESFQDFFDEFPYFILVDAANSFIRVTDPGSGSGEMIWEMRTFMQANGKLLAVVTETDSKPGRADSRIWFGNRTDGEWEELPRTLPYMHNHLFFDDDCDQAIFDKYELISIIFSLDPKVVDGISISPLPNFNFECTEGKLIFAEEFPAEDHAPICQAWKHFDAKTLAYQFDSASNTFLPKN